MKKIVMLLMMVIAFGSADTKKTVKYTFDVPKLLNTKVILYTDNTWEKVEDKNTSRQGIDDLVTSSRGFLHHVKGDYGQNSIHINVYYSSKTNKSIVGVTVNVRIETPFGKVILNEDSDVSLSLPNAETPVQEGWVFRDNPFIHDEMYDKLLPLVDIEDFSPCRIKIKKVIFSNGETFPL